MACCCLSPKPQYVDSRRRRAFGTISKDLPAVRLRNAKSGARPLHGTSRKADSFDRNAKGVCVDVSCADSVKDAVAETNAWAGPIPVLVNSAGIAGPNANVVDYDLDEWSRIQKINVDGTFLTNRFIVRQMLAEGYGRIVNIASIAGKEGNPTGFRLLGIEVCGHRLHESAGQGDRRQRHLRQLRDARGGADANFRADFRGAYRIHVFQDFPETVS